MVASLGQIVDGRWKVVERTQVGVRHYKYTLENIYNGLKVEFGQAILTDILNGKVSVSKIISIRIRKGGKVYAN